MSEGIYNALASAHPDMLRLAGDIYDHEWPRPNPVTGEAFVLGFVVAVELMQDDFVYRRQRGYMLGLRRGYRAGVEA